VRLVAAPCPKTFFRSAFVEPHSFGTCAFEDASSLMGPYTGVSGGLPMPITLEFVEAADEGRDDFAIRGEGMGGAAAMSMLPDLDVMYLEGACIAGALPAVCNMLGSHVAVLGV
jgi:hypothetical protein